MLTWSLACTASPASRAITSLAFMFVEVPEPVWNTSIGNCASCLPAGDLGGGALDARGAALGEQTQLAVDGGGGALDARQPVHDGQPAPVSPEIGKFSTALAVSPPQSCLSGIWISFGSSRNPIRRTTRARARGRQGRRRPSESQCWAARATAHRAAVAAPPRPWRSGAAGPGRPTAAARACAGADTAPAAPSRAPVGQRARALRP